MKYLKSIFHVVVFAVQIVPMIIGFIGAIVWGGFYAGYLVAVASNKWGDK